MKPRRRRLLWAAAFFILLPAVAAIWLLWPTAPEVPAPTLFPPGAPLALRLGSFREAWTRHWTGLGGDASGEAIQRFMESTGAWEDFAADEGDKAARKGIEQALSAMLRLPGRETWLAVGQWGEGRPTLILLTRRENFLRAGLADAAARAMVSGKAEKRIDRGVQISRAPLRHGDRELQWATVGGWICLTLSPTGGDAPPSPLARMIDQLGAARAGHAHPAGAALELEQGSDSALAGWIHPAELRREVQAFGGAPKTDSDPPRKKKKKKDKDKGKDTENAEDSGGWLDRVLEGLEGLDEARLRQTGPSLLDLEIELRGPAIAKAGDALASTAPLPALADVPSTPSASLAPCILQMDFARPFARDGAAFFGLDWDKLLGSLQDFDWLQPDFARDLRARLAGEGSPSGRLGWALYPNQKEPIPSAALWERAAPTALAQEEPADAWRMRPPASGEFQALYAPIIYTVVAPAPVREARRETADALWRGAATPPLAFASFNFDELAECLHGFPALVLKKRDRETWRRACAAADGFRIASGSVALRLDRRGDELVLTTRGLAMPKARR